GDKRAGGRLGEVEDLLDAPRGKGGDTVKVAAGGGLDGEGDGLGELLQHRAGEQTNVFSKRTEAARVDTQAVALGFICVTGFVLEIGQRSVDDRVGNSGGLNAEAE